MELDASIDLGLGQGSSVVKEQGWGMIEAHSEWTGLVFPYRDGEAGSRRPCPLDRLLPVYATKCYTPS